MDNPHGHLPEDDTVEGPPMPEQAELEALLEASEADAAAGRTVPLAPVLARMRAAAERIRRERASKDKTARSHG